MCMFPFLHVSSSPSCHSFLGNIFTWVVPVQKRRRREKSVNEGIKWARRNEQEVRIVSRESHLEKSISDQKTIFQLKFSGKWNEWFMFIKFPADPRARHMTAPAGHSVGHSSESGALSMSIWVDLVIRILILFCDLRRSQNFCPN